MESAEIYIITAITLFGVAYPIILQVITRLDEKYESNVIIRLFRKECEYKFFYCSLVGSLISIVIYSLKLEPLCDDFENSAIFWVAFATICSCVAFFLFVKKVMKYYDISSLANHLHERYKLEELGADISSLAKDLNERYGREENKIIFQALLDLFLLSIKQKKTELQTKLLEKFRPLFRSFYENQKKDKPVIYPEHYYGLVYTATQELAITEQRRNLKLEYFLSSALLDMIHYKKISDKTYEWLWGNLLVAIAYKRDDFIINHWKICHRYCMYSDSRGWRFPDERKEFMEFHFMLGGLLLYKRRYALIRELFTYSNHMSDGILQPVLLPKFMHDIFDFYIDIKDFRSIYNPNVDYSIKLLGRYPFPDLVTTVNRDTIAAEWAVSYMALLFLRQYTLQPTQPPITGPLDPPTIKSEKPEIDYFKKKVQEHLDNSELLKILHFDHITPEWCKEKGKKYPIMDYPIEYPINYLDRLKEKLKKS